MPGVEDQQEDADPDHPERHQRIVRTSLDAGQSNATPENRHEMPENERRTVTDRAVTESVDDGYNRDRYFKPRNRHGHDMPAELTAESTPMDGGGDRKVIQRDDYEDHNSPVSDFATGMYWIRYYVIFKH